MAPLKRAFQAFEESSTPEHGWELQKEMVAYADETSADPKENFIKRRSLRQLQTEKGGNWNARLSKVVELFASLGWEIASNKNNQWFQIWRISCRNDAAYLCLDSDGLSMSSGLIDSDRQPIPLKGEFQGYDDYATFTSFLSSNGIDLEE